jgi:O-antigen ligase
VVLMIVGPVMSLSRGGLLVTSCTVLLASALLIVAGLRRMPWWMSAGVAVGLIAAVAAGLTIGWPRIQERMSELRQGFELREQGYHIASRMAADSPVFGTGPETFFPLYQLYKKSPQAFWPDLLHNDWLEARITFGWVGFGMMLAGLAGAVGYWFVGSGYPVSWRLVGFIWLALATCLIHARWDFPLQVYSIMLLFLAYCAMLMSVEAKG